VSKPSRPSDVKFRPATDEPMSVCLRCGLFVANERRHREWHSGLTDLLEALRIAIMIGG
jgi:hypothetical protein